MKIRKKKCSEKIIINEDSKFRRIFDFWMLFMNAYSCVTSVFYVAFSPPSSSSPQYIFDFFVEAFFLFDIVLHFLTSYRDP